MLSDTYRRCPSVRPLKGTDYAAVRRLFNVVFDMSEDFGFVRAWRRRSCVRSVGCWLGFGSASSLVGAAIVGSDSNYLAYIFVDPDFQQMGIGSRLLRRITDSSPSLHLVPVDDPAIISWYEKFGFRLSSQIGRRRVLVKHAYETRAAQVERRLFSS